MPAAQKFLSSRASRVLDCLQNAPVITVEPGHTVECRTSYGIQGRKDDLAFSVEWQDGEKCLWAADFSTDALARAKIREGSISIRDMLGAQVVFQLYQPARQVPLPPRLRK